MCIAAEPHKTLNPNSPTKQCLNSKKLNLHKISPKWIELKPAKSNTKTRKINIQRLKNPGTLHKKKQKNIQKQIADTTLALIDCL
jgi:hypothetical protein